jgi:hypothetical protein
VQASLGDGDCYAEAENHTEYSWNKAKVEVVWKTGQLERKASHGGIDSYRY